MRCLITGAAGQLARALATRLAADHEVLAYRRDQLDLTDHDAVRRAIGGTGPDVVINGAAYNDVDGAEGDASGALGVNAFAVRSLAQASAEIGAVLVHYSTDFVFDGTATEPYGELVRPNPQSVYAVSKLLGEWFAELAPRHYVLRVESLFGGAAPGADTRDADRPRGGSLDRIADALANGREVRAFEDRIVSPSYIHDVAAATDVLLTRRAAYGLYHCVNSGAATWLEVSRELRRMMGSVSAIVPVRLDDMPLRARRPKFCALSNAKLTAAGMAMPTWQDALTRYLDGWTVRGA
jgi:dTDP-4-dehydrorhamnose reductase